jgi:hypothetical protein
MGFQTDCLKDFETGAHHLDHSMEFQTDRLMDLRTKMDCSKDFQMGCLMELRTDVHLDCPRAFQKDCSMDYQTDRSMDLQTDSLMDLRTQTDRSTDRSTEIQMAFLTESLGFEGVDSFLKKMTLPSWTKGRCDR